MLPSERVLDDGTSGWRRRGPDLETDRAPGCGDQLGEKMVMKSLDPLKSPIWPFKGKSVWLPGGWCVAFSVRLEAAKHALCGLVQGRELWAWVSGKENEILEPDLTLKLSPAHLLIM